MTRPLFTQSWIHAETLAHHAWRVFFRCPAVSPDQMTEASHASWAACFKAYQQLTGEERMLIREFYRWKPELRGIVVHGEEESNATGMDEYLLESEACDGNDEDYLTGGLNEMPVAKSEATAIEYQSTSPQSEATDTRFNHPVTVYPALRKASRLWAIERGLADDVPDLPRDRRRR